ncbi:MAG: EamA family transporter [Candidatus Woesearchaeota archaeon]|jgi:multidrug transporter EmrE-like cation transporter
MKLATILLIAGLCVTSGDIVLALWAKQSKAYLFLIGMLLNVAGIIVYAQSLRLESVGIATAMFLGINILAVTIMGMFVFKEMLNLKQALGLAGMVLAMVVLEV